MIKIGTRKLTAFVITTIFYSIDLLLAIIILKERAEILPAFAFQLASAFGILCGLFFGSNVLEHYSRKNIEN